jgi:hypothetical protein
VTRYFPSELKPTPVWAIAPVAGSVIDPIACPEDGTATRTIWQPVAVSSAICCSVALTSAVRVVVIDWTDTGAPPPTGTACLPWPTMIWRDFRRGASGSRAGWGMPRSIVMTPAASLDDVWCLTG